MRLYTVDNNTHMKLYFAGATRAGQSRVREQIRMTLKTPEEDEETIATPELFFNLPTYHLVEACDKKK
jgi:hypothetical protein